MSFFRRNLSFFKLAILTNLEYRLNYFIDAIAQPILTSGIEIAFWSAVFATGHFSSGSAAIKIAGFDLNSYLAYAIWASFIARISVNWMYEFRMIEEIESGGLNTLLVRPMSFFEYYLSQFLGYKLITTLISLCVPLVVTAMLDLPLIWSRLLPSLLLAIYYLFFLYILSFITVTFSFHLTRIQGITMAKNLSLWIFSGELLPLDIFPSPYREWLIKLPFSNGVFVPVAYITGRIGPEVLWLGFQSISIGIVVASIIAWPLWKLGLRRYVGTGA